MMQFSDDSGFYMVFRAYRLNRKTGQYQYRVEWFQLWQLLQPEFSGSKFQTRKRFAV